MSCGTNNIFRYEGQPSLLKTSNAYGYIKQYVMGKLGWPTINVEVDDSFMSSAIKVMGDFVATYFKNETRVYGFLTQPLVGTYDLPPGALVVEDVLWSSFPSAFNNSIFSYQYHMINNGSLFSPGSGTGLLDYHLLSNAIKSMEKVFGGYNWSIESSDDDGSTPADEISANSISKIRLHPTPKTVHPVAVVYMPEIKSFKNPSSRLLAYDIVTAEVMISLGMVRRKLSNAPTPDGGSIGLDGDNLVQEGMKLREDTKKAAIDYGEPLGFIIE